MPPEQLTIIGILIAIGGAGLAKQWVFGWVYQAKADECSRMAEDRDFWRDAFLQQQGITVDAIAVAKKK